MKDALELPPYRLAGLVAPAVDRVFHAGVAAGRAGGGADLSRRYGGPSATGFLGEFRTRLARPGGAVSDVGFAAVTRYRDPIECKRMLDKQVAYGMITRDGNGLVATERGRAYLTDVYALHASVLRELWEREHAVRVSRLVDLLGRAIVAAAPTGGDAFAAMAPPFEPDGTPPGVLLLNRLGTLRFHRADAHAAAWTAAGHTAQTIVALPAGAERTAIEQETDRRAAPPWADLTPDERLMLLSDLAALP